MEVPEVFIERGTDRGDVYVHNGVVLSHEKRMESYIFDNMDGPKGYYTN